MGGKPLPESSILDNFEMIGVRSGRKTWYSSKSGRYYQWDSLHGEVEVYSKRGRHLGVVNYRTGSFIKDPIKGRRIDV
ncbi:MAG: hypothetical protein GY799_11730 [Desulfobulbaceae bacterium]|nr:hypothetical protein [Desulfobulbaceae bacterium]